MIWHQSPKVFARSKTPKKNKISGFPSSMFFTRCFSPSEMCEQFASFFKSGYISDECSFNSGTENSNVNSALSIIDARKSSGPDQ